MRQFGAYVEAYLVTGFSEITVSHYFSLSCITTLRIPNADKLTFLVVSYSLLCKLSTNKIKSRAKIVPFKNTQNLTYLKDLYIAC